MSAPLHSHPCITCDRPVDCDCDQPDYDATAKEHVWCREGMTRSEYNRAFKDEF
jgi:hypothetical protein